MLNLIAENMPRCTPWALSSTRHRWVDITVLKMTRSVAKPKSSQAFEDADALHLLGGFASHHGADFYGFERNADTVTLVREEWTVPPTYAFGDSEVVPLRSGESIRWRLADDSY